MSEGWNRPKNEEVNAVEPKRGVSLRFVVVAFLVVCIVAAAIVFLLSSGGEQDAKKETPKRETRIKQVEHVKAPATQEVKEEGPKDPKKPFSRFARRSPEEARAELEARKAAGENIRNLSIGSDGQPRYKLRFTNPAEREIERILIHTPGEPMMGIVRYDKNFEERFMASLANKVEILPDDAPADIEIKQTMEETKKEIVERIKNGETLKDILEESRKEIDRLARYRQDLVKMVNEAKKNGDYSDQDIADCIDAANKMLSDNGMRPINKSIFTRRAVRRMVEGKPIGRGQ